MNQLKRIFIYLLPLALLMGACSAETLPDGEEPGADDVTTTPVPDDGEKPTAEPDVEPPPDGDNNQVGEAYVNSVSLNLMESFPLQASVLVQGDLADGCTTLGEAIQSQEGNTIYLTIQTNRPADQACDMALRPFEETFGLDILGLPAGEYTIDVNGVTTEMSLTQDNS